MKSRGPKRTVQWTFSPDRNSKRKTASSTLTDNNGNHHGKETAIQKGSDIPTEKIDKSLFDFWRSPKMARVEDGSLKSSIRNSPTKSKKDLPILSSHPPSIVADVEDLMVGSSFFSEPDLLTTAEVGKTNKKANRVSEERYILLLIDQVDTDTFNGGLPQIVLKCGSTIVYLRDLWIGCDYQAGASISVAPFTDASSVVIDGSGEYVLIYEPQRLLSITTVADAVACPRKAALSMGTPASVADNPPTIHLATGSIVHEIFEETITDLSIVSSGDLGPTITRAIQRNALTIYACGVDEREAEKHVVDIMKSFPAWIDRFIRDAPHSDAKVIDELRAGLPEASRNVCIPSVYSIEESITSRMYGLKGKIDAVVMLRFIRDGEPISLVVPLELKTGRSTNSTAHRAQTLLYALLLSDRYGLTVNYGLLFYMAPNTLLRICATGQELQALLMIRNRLAASARHLPKPINNSHQCRRCAQLSNCAVMSSFEAATGDDVDALNETLRERVRSLPIADSKFYYKWNSLLELEEAECRKSSSATKAGGNLNIILQHCTTDKNATGFGRCTAEFIIEQEQTGRDLNVGDPVSIVSETGDDVGIGFIISMTANRIIINCDHDIGKLLVPSSLETGDCAQQRQHVELQSTIGCRFGLCKDEMMTGFALGRSNLAQLYYEQQRSLYELFVEQRTPKFSAPTIANASSAAGGLDDGQRAAIEHCLSAQDYALLLGMPGTGKTTTLVALIKCLTDAGQRVLISSYTHSAVDNLMVKLVKAGIKALRIGNTDRIDGRLAACTLNQVNFPTTASIGKALAEHRVIGLTCLGVNHPIFATTDFDYCIIDEASQITVPSIIGPLLLAKKFILVGDHYQLPPLVRSAEAVALGLNQSLFKVLAEAHPQAVTTLCRQYRMCEDIQFISNKTVYQDRLVCGSEDVAKAVLNLDVNKLFCTMCGDSPSCWIRSVLQPSVRVIFLDTDAISASEEPIGNSFQNPVEAICIKHLTDSMLGCGIIGSEQICIISAFRPQVRLLSELVPGDIEVSTVDRYQGRDKDCVILSFVRSNHEQKIGSLLRDWHRLNVAFTRARKKLIMLGSWSTVMSHPQMTTLRTIIQERHWYAPLPAHAPSHDPI